MGKATILVPSQVKRGEIITVKFIIIHPMETGTRKNPMTGKIEPVHYITNIELFFNGNKIAEFETGTGVSRNPSFSIKMKAVVSGKLELKYVDNKGEKGSEIKELKVSE